MGRDQHEIGGLLELTARRIDVGDAGGLLAGAVEIDPQDLAVGAKLVVGIAERDRQDDGLRTRLGEVLAGEAFAESAEDALLQRQPLGIGIGLAHRRRGRRVGMVAQALGAFAEERGVVGLLHRRRWIVARPRPFEWVSAVLDAALDVSRPAAGAAEILEAIVVRLELVVGDAPVLDRELWIDEAPAVALLEMCPVDEVRPLASACL